MTSTRLLLTLAATITVLLAEDNPSWKRPHEPFKIAGNLYYVGTEDLACYLIATPKGNILINTGLVDSTPLLRASFTKLGFKLEDVKILLTMQAHYDHVAAMAEVQKLTHAKVYATAGDKVALESGGKIDNFDDNPAHQFAPIHVDRILKDGDTVELGGATLHVLSHPGHTKGSASYQLTADGKPVLIVNLLSVVQPLVGNKNYPNIVDDYKRSFAAQEKLHPGIWVTGHASQCDLDAKWKAGSFDDPKGYVDAVAEYDKSFHERLAKESNRK